MRLVRGEGARRVGILAAALACLGLACATHHPSTRGPLAPGSAHAHADTSPASPPLPKGPQHDPRLDALLEERDRLTDWRNTIYGLGLASPPSPALALPLSGAPFPEAKEVALVRAYLLQQAVGDDVDLSTTRIPFTPNGQLDPSVVPPEATLTADEAARLLTLVDAARAPSPVSSRCDFYAHHALVFFDARGRPRAKILVCMACGEWVGVPAFDGAPIHPRIMSATEKAAVGAILDAHHLGAWIFDEDGAMRAEAVAYERLVFGTRDAWTEEGRAREASRRAKPSGVDPGLSAARASADVRARLCTWLRDERSRRGIGYGSHGYQCDDGRTFATDDELSSCERPMACDVPLGRVEACLRRFLEPAEICLNGLGPDCEGLESQRACVPGVRFPKATHGSVAGGEQRPAFMPE